MIAHEPDDDYAKTAKLEARCAPDLKRQVEQLAARRSITAGELVREAVAAAVRDDRQAA